MKSFTKRLLEDDVVWLYIQTKIFQAALSRINGMTYTNMSEAGPSGSRRSDGS